MAKYEIVSGEGEHQPGAEDGVLRNIPGITSRGDITAAETELLESLYIDILADLPETISFGNIRSWHRVWLGNLYYWAGELRSVNMSKGDFHFAAANQLPKLVAEFEQTYLVQFKSLPEMEIEALVLHLAATHVEFILIHPFREGNGRLSRLLMNAQLIRAGFDLMDYQRWDDNREFYFKAIQAGVAGDYSHIARLVRDSLAD